MSLGLDSIEKNLLEIDKFMKGGFVQGLTFLLNRLSLGQLEKISKLLNLIDPTIEVVDIQKGFDFVRYELDEAKKVDVTKLINLCEWLKRHPRILQFLERKLNEALQ